MLYFTTKTDIKFLEDFKRKVIELGKLKTEVRKYFGPSFEIMGEDYRKAVLDKATASGRGKILREELARDIPRAIEIAKKSRVIINFQSSPAPQIGGVIIPINLFHAILIDTSYDGVDENWINDKLNETIGQSERRIRIELFKLFNPLYWIYSILVFLVQIPFHIVSISGFDVSKVEDHFVSKLFKLAEIIIIVYILIKLGIEKTDIVGILKTIIK